MTTPTKLSIPDHRLQAFDKDGKMTPEFFKLVVAIIIALNTLL